MSRIITAVLCILLLTSSAWAAKVNLPRPDPANNEAFGTEVKVLPNGNFVVTDPYFDSGGIADVGRVYLYNRTGTTVLATLKGSQANDQVGSGGITVLSNGNYVVNSPGWDNGAVADAGAVTWRSATGANPGGGNEEVSEDNSLVGTTTNDRVGDGGVTALSNGNYVVSSSFWNNGAVAGVGAVTWRPGSGNAAAIGGEVSAANSLVGSSGSDYVGETGVTALTNGNYVVSSYLWDNGAATNVGAVTWRPGAGATADEGDQVSAGNSLVGSTDADAVGFGGVTALSNGNYVVNSRYWNNGDVVDGGAVTWGNGAGGTAGAVSNLNSLVGTTTDDAVGFPGVTALTNGNYVVRSFLWDNGAVAPNAGAVTWGNGAGGTAGAVSNLNSLVGSTTSDRVGEAGVTALTNGHYVVNSPDWDNGAVAPNAGAVTWRPGSGNAAAIGGAVSEDNSLVGTTTNDRVGEAGVTALTNGNYVVSTPGWNDGGGAGNAGAVTWGNGATGISGAVSALNSLVGDSNLDNVGYDGVTALSNGHYVVSSSLWDNGGTADVGAVTWRDGTGPSNGIVSTDNSLYGNGAGFTIGSGGVTALGNGHYVVASPGWGFPADRGAVTWQDGAGGFSGSVSGVNSLIGSTDEDQVGVVTALPNNDYVVQAPLWDNADAGTADVGVIAWGSGSGGTEGVIDPDADNTVAGTIPSGGEDMVFDYAAGDGAGCDQLVIGRPDDNIVTLLGNPACLFKDGFE